MHYKNNRIEKLCTDQRTMRKQRPDLAKKLPLRVRALQAADTLGDLAEIDPGGHWHKLSGTADKDPDTWAGSVSGNWRILVEPSPKGTPAAVEVTVTEIRDYH